VKRRRFGVERDGRHVRQAIGELLELGGSGNQRRVISQRSAPATGGYRNLWSIDTVSRRCGKTTKLLSHAHLRSQT
jgi:hypothetical protein